MVPKGWIKAPVRDFGHVSAGRQRSPNFTKGTLRPYLRVANVFENYIDTTDVNEMMFTESEYQRYKLEIGDILLNEGQSTELVGRPAMYVGYPENCCFQNTLVRFKADHDNLDASYALQRFLLCLYDGTFQAISKKTTSIAHLGVSRFAELNLLWPPLVEQQKITQILSTWDQAISATEKLLENSQQQKKALMQKLLTGKKRLLDEDGVRFSGAWKHIKLRSLIKEIKRDKEENPNNIELLTVKLHNKGVIASGKFPNSTEGGRPYYKRFAGELIIGRQNLHNGGVAIVPSECNGLIASNAISSFEVLKDCDINFILSIMSTSHFRYVIDNLTGGTGQKEVSIRELLNVFVFIPCIEEQQKIAKVISLANQEIDNLQKKLDCLKQEKKALMQQLLTGKKRVKVAA